MRLSFALSMVLVTAGFASAGTIYSVGGTADTPFTIGGAGIDQMLVSSWTESGPYANVSISAELFNGNGAPISVYLTNSVGPGTTVANEIATTTVSPATSDETDTLFSGLSLGSGTYYLILAAPGVSTYAGWYGTNSATFTEDTGVTGSADTFVSDQSGSPNDALPPASTFTLGGTNLLFTVTGDAGSPTPEPSSFILVGLAGTFLLCAKKRLAR